jgi:L-iditol 2-dehydrogenase
MRALRFNVSIPGFVLARGLGRVTEAAVFGRLSGLRYTEVAEPSLPGPDWVRLRVLACGICGTDLQTLTLRASPALEPFGSFPAVPGHEILAEVTEVGERVRDLDVGTRVAVDPMLHCRVRGYAPDEWCASCGEGRHGTCELAGEEGPLRVDGAPLSAGLTIGYHRDLPGGWGERMVAHRSQLFPVARELGDRAAVLIEPLSIGMHAVLNAPPGPGVDVLVIGSGPIAMGMIWALRATGFEGAVLAQVKRPHEAELARRLGATEAVQPGLEAREALTDTGALAYQPIIGDEVFSGGGFPVVYDCVGSGGSLRQALRYAAPRGRVVLLGCAAEIRKLDLTFLWARALEVRGFVGYGTETWRGERLHTFEVTHRLLLETGARVEELVTHVFPLAEYRRALSAAANHRRSGAVKVVLEP